MLENKKLNMILSLLIAIALWAFVIGEVNPEASRLYRDVPVKLVNEETLEQNDMAVYSVSNRTINVTLSGTRSEINKIDIKDIVATIDLGDAVMGENQLQINVKVPNKVEIESQSADKSVVIVEERVSKTVPVEVSYEGTFDNEEEPVTVEQNLSTVMVYGAASTVDQVAFASARVPENSITAEIQEIRCDLFAANSTGQRIFNVELSSSEVLITSELAKLKTVPLFVPLHGENSGGVTRTVVTPEEITIKGKTADLDPIDSITTEPLDLADVFANKTITLTPILPEDVEVSAESANLEAVVHVTKIENRSMTFNQSKIEFRGLDDGMSAKAADTAIELTITGSESQLESLTKEGVSLFVDLEGLTAGRHKVALQAECGIAGAIMDVSPKRVIVTIKADKNDDDTAQPGNGSDNNENNNHESEE